VDSAVEIGEPLLHARLIGLPGHAVHTRSGMPLQCRKAVPEQIAREMVE
jgi:hypothetical protein